MSQKIKTIIAELAIQIWGLFILGALTGCMAADPGSSRAQSGSNKFDYELIQSWKEAGNTKIKGQIWVDRALEKDIQIAFDWPYRITDSWRFKILEQKDAHYRIQIIENGTDALHLLAEGKGDGRDAPTNVVFRPQTNDSDHDLKNGAVPGSTKPKITAPQNISVEAPEGSPVALNGRLQVNGTALQNQLGEAIQLKGAGSHGLQWYSKYITYDSIKWMRDSWKASLIRAAMYTDEDGYISKPEVKNRVFEAVDSAIATGVYVIIDWHILRDRNPMWNIEAAKSFFDEMSRKYARHPNIIYEIANEPNGADVRWDGQIKPYAEQIIAIIRKNDPTNIIIVGTPDWSSNLDEPSKNPLRGQLAKNVMYTFHYYAGSHGDVSQKINTALARGLPIFVTEWGLSEANGTSADGKTIYRQQADAFLGLLAFHKISWSAWSLSDNKDTSSLLQPGAETKSFGKDSQLTEAGKYVKYWLSR